MRYGVDTRWIQKAVSGTASCTNAYFGSDPAYGVVKACYFDSDPPPSTWTFVANEGQSFTVSGTKNTRYGVDTHWIEKVVSGTAQCTNTYYGSDPAYAVVKACYVGSDAPPFR